MRGLDGRTSRATTDRSSARWVGSTKQRNTSLPPAPSWKSSSACSTRSGSPSCQPSVKCRGGGASFGPPAGDPKGAPPPRHFTDGWQLGEPDLVLQADEDFQLGAGGKDVFRCFVLPTHLAEDRSVVALEVRPSNPRIVHH